MIINETNMFSNWRQVYIVNGVSYAGIEYTWSL